MTYRTDPAAAASAVDRTASAAAVLARAAAAECPVWAAPEAAAAECRVVAVVECRAAVAAAACHVAAAEADGANWEVIYETQNEYDAN